jgi:hypothetical protein
LLEFGLWSRAADLYSAGARPESTRTKFVQFAKVFANYVSEFLEEKERTKHCVVNSHPKEEGKGKCNAAAQGCRATRA